MRGPAPEGSACHDPAHVRYSPYGPRHGRQSWPRPGDRAPARCPGPTRHRHQPRGAGGARDRRSAVEGQAAGQVTALPLPLDVGDPAQITAAAEHLRNAGAALDVLVNNAGIAMDGFDAEVARRTIDANFVGTMS